jgi:hypothetical protein
VTTVAHAVILTDPTTSDAGSLVLTATATEPTVGSAGKEPPMSTPTIDTSGSSPPAPYPASPGPGPGNSPQAAKCSPISKSAPALATSSCSTVTTTGVPSDPGHQSTVKSDHPQSTQHRP